MSNNDQAKEILETYIEYHTIEVNLWLTVKSVV